MKYLLLFLWLSSPCSFLRAQTFEEKTKSIDRVHGCDSIIRIIHEWDTLTEIDLFKNTLVHYVVTVRAPCSDTIIRLLIARGVPVNAINSTGETPLDLAVDQKDENLICLLMELGGKMNTPCRSGPLCKAIERGDQHRVRHTLKYRRATDKLDELFPNCWSLFGPRLSYSVGTKDFVGIGYALNFQDFRHTIAFIPLSHFGMAIGSDMHFAKSTIFAPKIAFEYRNTIFLARAGYMHYIGNHQQEAVPYAEIGLSVLGYLDITYMHGFHTNHDPFGAGSNFINVTATITVF